MHVATKYQYNSSSDMASKQQSNYYQSNGEHL